MRALPIAYSCILLAACGSGDNGGNSPPPITWTTNVVDIQTMQPLKGVNVCIAPLSLVCGTSDASGNATLMVPSSSEFMLTYNFQGYISQFTEHTSTTMSGSNSYLMVSSTVQGILAAAVGDQIDATKSILVFSAIDAKSNPLGGATFAETPAGGDGPFYFGGVGLPDKSAKSASSNGLGFMLNLDPGDYNIVAAIPGKKCTGSVSKSWQGTTATSVKGHAVAGGMTTVSFVCQ